MKPPKVVSFLTTLLFVLFSVGFAFADSEVKLTVGTATADVDQPVTINIMAEPVGADTNVAGAAFTLQYDNSLTVTVDSDFFGTFLEQEFTETHGLDDNGTVDGYEQPLVSNEVNSTNPTLMKIAAARKDGGAISGSTVLFTLQVSGSTPGIYPIELIPTTLENADAGYMSPTDINLLVGVGAEGSADEFPIRLYAINADSATYVQSGSVTISELPKGDVSGDGTTNSVDALTILQYLAGNNPPMNGLDPDVNKDGTVNAVDALMILQYLAGNITELP